MVQVPGIGGRGRRLIEARAHESKLVGGNLAEQHGSGPDEPARNLGILGGHMPGPQVRAAGGRDAPDIDQVLEGNGNAVERTMILPSRQLVVGLRGRSQGSFLHDRDKGMNGRIDQGNPLQMGLREGKRRERAVAQPCPRLGDRQVQRVQSPLSPATGL